MGEEATAQKLLCQISEMYSTISFKRLKRMFFDNWNQRRIEDLVIELVEKNYIWCRMSHSEGILVFRAPERLERSNFMKNYLPKLANNLNRIYNLVENRKR